MGTAIFRVDVELQQQSEPGLDNVHYVCLVICNFKCFNSKLPAKLTVSLLMGRAVRQQPTVSLQSFCIASLMLPTPLSLQTTVRLAAWKKKHAVR